LIIEPTTVFRKIPDARYRNVGSEGIVVRQAAGEVLVLSEVGARVLDLIESGAPFGRLLTTLAAEYEIGEAILERDVIDYLHEVLEAGIIEPVTT
jgi:hypothetical protein